MDFQQCRDHIGEDVLYRDRVLPARPGKIVGVHQLVHVQFTDHDGGVLAVNPFCLELAREEPQEDPQLEFET